MTSNDLFVKSNLQSANATVSPKPLKVEVAEVKETNTAQKAQDKATNSILAAPLEEQQEQLEAKVAELNDYVQHLNRNLQFSVDEQSGQTVVKVVDSETKELVRQIPSQEVLDARNAAEEYRGLLLKAKV